MLKCEGSERPERNEMRKKFPGKVVKTTTTREKDENEFPDDGKFIDFSSFSSRLLSSLFSTRRTMTTASWWSFAVVS